jgi:hypothetical protein
MQVGECRVFSVHACHAVCLEGVEMSVGKSIRAAMERSTQRSVDQQHTRRHDTARTLQDGTSAALCHTVACAETVAVQSWTYIHTRMDHRSSHTTSHRSPRAASRMVRLSRRQAPRASPPQCRSQLQNAPLPRLDAAGHQSTRTGRKKLPPLQPQPQLLCLSDSSRRLDRRCTRQANVGKEATQATTIVALVSSNS